MSFIIKMRGASVTLFISLQKKKKKKMKEKVLEECESPAPKKRKSEKSVTETPDENGNTDTLHIKVAFSSSIFSLFIAICRRVAYNFEVFS